MRPVICNAIFGIVAMLVLALPPAFGHAELGYNLRAAHFDYTASGMMVYLRLSFTLLVANKLGQKNSDGSYVPAPYTYNRIESGRVFHYLDIKAVKRDPQSLGKFAIQGHDISLAGKLMTAELINVRVHPKGTVPPFAKLEDAKNSCKGLPYVSARDDEIDSGYVLVDITLLYPQITAADVFEIKSSLLPGELGEPATKNIFWDHRGAERETSYGIDGLLDVPVTLSPAKQP